MAIEVMRRVENKYLLNTYTYMQLLKTIERNAELDEYNNDQDFYTISNIYYDTDDNHLIRTSLSKPEYKEKLRLRAYGVPNGCDNVFLEIKKKYKGVVNKRRATLNLTNAYEFTETYCMPDNSTSNTQIASELEYALKLYKPKPKVYIAYDRRAYFADGGLRITFDTNIRTRRYDLRLEWGDYGESLLDDDTWLMEIKTNRALPLWLVKLLSEYKVHSTSFSKYGTEYKQFLMNGGGQKCLNQSSAPEQIPQSIQLRFPSPGRVRLPQYA